MILAGLTYYYLYPDVLFVKRIDHIFRIKRHIPDFRFALWKPIRNYMFDFIWAYSFTSALLLLLAHGLNTKQKRQLLYVAFVFEIVIETMQLIPKIPGTFDLLDIVIEIIASICAILILNGKEIIHAKG